MALVAGTKLGSYEIIAPLGAGGMGEVYRARDPQLGRDVALKILPVSVAKDPDRLRRFEQEARAAAALNHPNILAVYQFGTHDGAPYLVSELLEGSTLRDQLSRGPIAVRKAIDYAMQTARGLAAAHEKGIVHRDLKPENLFLTKDGRTKILDFGLAKLMVQPHAGGQSSSDPSSPTLTEGTEPGLVLGTVGYMSPEQIRGENTDNRTDLFALGAILYELLTGKRAFHKPTSAETMAAILNEDPPSASQIAPAPPPALQKVMQRCLEKNPEQRFHSASDLAFALEALSDSGTAQSGLQALPTPARRWPFMVVVSAAAAIVVVILALWLWPGQGVPFVESVVQLTNDPNAKSGWLATDGTRVYFTRGTPGAQKLAQVSVHGGEIGEISTQLNNPQIAGLSADGSSLLLVINPYIQTSSQVWSLPLPAGEPRRLAAPAVDDAFLFPDGRIIYTMSSSVYMADKDGSNPRKLEAFSRLRRAPNPSPDGRRLNFSTFDTTAQVRVIHVAAADGTGAHDVLRGNTQGLPAEICCARWTPDQKYMIFTGVQDGRSDIWAIRDEKPLMGKSPVPMRLTNGPLSYDTLAPSRDGKQIFAIGTQRRGELVRFDPHLREFIPFLGGISALDPVFSRDGQWVVYVSYPDGTLWRSRGDNSERLQLTYPPTRVTFARISPDGKRVAFSDGDGNAFLTSMSGGTPQKLGEGLNAPDWSPDGNFLVTTAGLPGPRATGQPIYVLTLIDLRSGQVSNIPGAEGKLGGWYVSPDSLIAVTEDQMKFQEFNFKTQKWTDVIMSPGNFTTWETSADLKYFFYASGGNDPKIFRMRLSDRMIEEVTGMKNFAGVDNPALSVGPDDSAVLTRNTGSQEVYALTIKWP